MSREATATAVREAPAVRRPRPPVSKMYRILVVDDHSIVRRGIRSLLESQPG